MKRSSIFIVAVIAILFVSCKKEINYSDVQASQSAVSSNASDAVATTPLPKLTLNATGTNYGALIDASDAADGYTFTTDVASKLGLSCVRDATIVPSSKKVQTLNSQFNILLNFTSGGAMPQKFRTDLSAYQTDLRNTIAALYSLPKLAVIENEESNSKYYNAPATDYINQLKAAITVMHSYGIPVTNGGITSVGLRYLVYEDYMSRGMTAQANDYKKRMHVGVNQPSTQERGAFISTLLTAYATMDLDYVNFHWYSQAPGDAQGLGETIAYLQSVLPGKKIITNEMGQMDQDPATLTSTVQMCKSYNFPYIVWYSGDEGGKSFPLQYQNENLTTSGVAYQGFIATNQ